MQRDDSYNRNHWNRRDWDDRRGTPETAEVWAELGGLLRRTGIWVAGCLALASLMPPVLVAPLLRELLLLSAVVESMTGLLRGESLTLQQFNRQDVALLLLAFGLCAGLFVDHAALQALVQTAAGGGVSWGG